MKALYDIKEQLFKALDKIAAKGELNTGDLELTWKVTDTIKNIDKICMLEEANGYSQDGAWRAHMEGEYGRGSSYRGRHWVKGHYSRDDGRDYSMDNSRNNSRDGGRGYSRGSMADHIDDMMRSATTEAERKAIREFAERFPM